MDCRLKCLLLMLMLMKKKKSSLREVNDFLYRILTSTESNTSWIFPVDRHQPVETMMLWIAGLLNKGTGMTGQHSSSCLLLRRRPSQGFDV